MGDFADLDKFYANLRYQVENGMKNEFLPKIKEYAQDYLIKRFYKTTPKIYNRLNLLVDSLLIKCKWEGDTCVGTLYVSSDMHPTSNWDVFEGNVDHTFDEIINIFLVNGRSYEDGLRQEDKDLSIDVLKATQEEFIETGEAIQVLYKELRSKFDII